MGQKDLEGMRQFFNWLDTHRDMIATTPQGYINTVRGRYRADTQNDIKDTWTASRWIRKYRIIHCLKIKRLTIPYVPHKHYQSSYYERSIPSDAETVAEPDPSGISDPN